MPDAPDTRPPFTVEPCRSCEEPIIWAVTTNARPMPVDAEPAQTGGNIALDYKGPDAPPLARVLSVAQRFGRRLRTSHFVTCPQAGQWRRRGRP